uniref:ANF_receptor domain-containing protein n=1 Tax=Globodera pallida TaxID=36090 RepID=A0A183CKW3_GLOPA
MGPQVPFVLLIGFLLPIRPAAIGAELSSAIDGTFHREDGHSSSERRQILLIESLFFGQPLSTHLHRTYRNRTRRQTVAQIAPQTARIGDNISADRTSLSSSTIAPTKKAPAKNFVKKELQGKVVVKIGHIGAQGAMPNGDRVLEISRMALLDEGILGEELDFDILSIVACGDSYEGVAGAAAMYHKEKVRVFLGPYCASEFEAVAKMCSFWNIPAISYMPTTTAVSDRNIYKTLARISSMNTNLIAKALVRLVEHYNWKKLAIVTNTGPIAYERVSAFEEEFRRANAVAVVKKFVLDENWDSNEIIRSGLLADLSANARGKSPGGNNQLGAN